MSGPDGPPDEPVPPQEEGPPRLDPAGGRRPTEPTGAPLPTEPTSPIDRVEDRSRPWLLGWAVMGVVGIVAAVWALLAEASTEVQALALSVPLLAAAIIIHHLLVTQDAGELSFERAEHLPDDLLEDRAAATLGRRPLLVRGAIALGAIGAVGALVGVRQLGPRRRRDSAWAPGVAVVTIDGDRLRPEDIPVGGVVTGWPQHAIDVELAAIMVIRLRDDPMAPTDLTGVVDDHVIAYSRICTHAGCPVALFRAEDQALFCPCHQATFDARRAATPTFGPASGPLPQLPLGIDDDGFLVALDDFPVTPGPVGGEVHG